MLLIIRLSIIHYLSTNSQLDHPSFSSSHALDLLRMLQNPVLLTMPFLSPLLAPAIISLSSSSVMSSPRSWATRFNSSKLMAPSLSRSKSSKALSSSYQESFSLILVIIMSKNSWKSILPLPSLSKLPIKFLNSSFEGSKPRARRATFSSLASIVPEPEVSKRSKASLISCFCCSESSYLQGFFFFLTSLSAPFPSSFLSLSALEA